MTWFKIKLAYRKLENKLDIAWYWLSKKML